MSATVRENYRVGKNVAVCGSWGDKVFIGGKRRTAVGGAFLREAVALRNFGGRRFYLRQPWGAYHKLLASTMGINFSLHIWYARRGIMPQ